MWRCANARTWGPTVPPRPRCSRWSTTSRWSSRAPGCGPRSCTRARRRRRWAGACRPRRSAPRWRIGPNGARPVTTTSCARRTWVAPSHSSPRHRAAASSRTWSYSPRPRWRSPRTARNSHSAKKGCQDMADSTTANTAIVPRVSGGEEEHGHLEEFRTDPIGLMQRIRDECGDVGWFQLVDKHVVFLSGTEANEFFFRSADEDLDQAEAYPFMTPIFGKGVVFDASPERRKEMLHNSALRGEQMKGHAVTIEGEVKKMIADWGDEGEIELLDFFSELTIYTSTACLIGLKFREQLDGRFAHYYHELERGTDPLCYVDPYLPIESFRRRDEARVKLVALVQEIMDARLANPPTDKADRDMLDVLVSIKDEEGDPRFSADEVTGMFISLMFAGHHTSSGTSAWTLIELIRHSEVYAEVLSELEELYADGQEVSFHALRQIPKLDNVVKETLRLHPPLIILMRVAKGDFEVQGFPIRNGDFVAASPAVSNRIPEDFPDPDAFIPDRYDKPEQADVANRWTWIPFGAGRHRCVGAAFATMQIKAIFSVLLREYEFEMAQPADTYRNDHSKMVVQLDRPAKVRYRKRNA